MGSLFSARAGRAALLALAVPAPFLIPAAARAQVTTLASLDPVVVTANRTPQPLSTVLADVSVVERDEIERSGAVDVADVLARLPGIEFARNGGPGMTTSVFIRGSETRHTAVYIDGVRVDSQATGGALWEQIPLDQIERIEVLRGPAATVYGSDAVAGVVQLFTRHGQGAARPTASLTLGSYRTVQAQAGVSGSTPVLDYALSASHGTSEGFNSQPVPTANPDKDGWRRSAAQGRVGVELGAGQRLEAALLASRLRAQFDGFTPGVDDRGELGLLTTRLAWQGRWSERSTTRLQLGRTGSTYESQPSFYRTETTLHDVTLQHEEHIAGQWLSATLERRADELFNPATDFGAAFGGRRHQDGVGLGWRADVGAFGWQAQLRHDQDSEFGGHGSGSLAAGWRFLPAWRVTAAAASSFRAPTLYQRFSQYGNPTLVPETGRNLELGLRWAAAGSEASLSVWRNRVSHLIGFGDPGPCVDAFGCYVNVGRARLEGLTLAGRTQIAGLGLRGSLDWHDPRDLEADKLLPRRARRLANLAAERPWSGGTLGVELQAAGPRYDDAANTRRLGGYALLNLFASTTLQPGLALEGRIDNLADKTYELARTYATPGRNLQATLRWTLP